MHPVKLLQIDADGAEDLGLDLADPFPAEAEAVPQFVEGHTRPPEQPVAEAEDFEVLRIPNAPPQHYLEVR